MNGQVYPIEFNDNMNASQLIAMVAEREGVKAEEVTLVSAGKPIKAS